MVNLVFLDSRDLIDCIEHSDPCDHRALADQLRARDAAIVLTMTNVLEVIPRGRPVSDAVELARRLESIPHVFACHPDISTVEFSEAITAFENESQPELRLPVRSSFWRVLVPTALADDPARSEFHRSLDQLPMSEQLRLVFMGGQGVSSGQQFVDELTDILADHRDVLGVTPPSKALFRHAVQNQLAYFSFHVSDVTRFADWLFRSPMVCPGWRLGHEAFQELRLDQTAGMKTSGLPDLTHVYFLPYVAAATLDRQWRDYCQRAGRRLANIGIQLPYLPNLHADTAELLSAWRPSAGA